MNAHSTRSVRSRHPKTSRNIPNFARCPFQNPGGDCRCAPFSQACYRSGQLDGTRAIGFPNGFGEHGLPTGISLLGRPFAEAKLASIVRTYQTRTDFHERRPALHV